MRRWLACLAMAFVTAWPALAWAGTIYVDDDAPNDPGPGNPTVSDPLEDGSADHPFDAIQEGIDAAVNRDTVLVEDGTYTGDGNRDIDFLGKAITVASENGADTCIIDCEGSESDPHRGFCFHSGETLASVVAGFTIRNGYVAGDGGAILCDWDSDATVVDCTVSGNGADSDGGGICSSPLSELAIVDCTISGNAASTGGGVCCAYESVASITGCTISGNSAWKGGGVFCWNYTPSITDCTITNNEARDDGGGLVCLEGYGTVRGCTISGNSAAHSGGGIYSWRSGVTISGCAISDNSAGIHGGGVCCYSAFEVTITKCTINGNSAGTDGGGICCTHGELVLDPVVINCTIIANEAAAGGGVMCSDYSNPALWSCTIVGNTAGTGAGVNWGFESDPTIVNCIVWGNIGPEVYGSSSVVLIYCDVEEGTGEPWFGTGCMDAPPLLTPDGHLTTGSPCIDCCPTGPADDVDGEARPVDIVNIGNAGTETYDMGADEFIEIDTDGDGLPDWWEDENGLDPNDPADGWSNADGDWLPNAEEYAFGSDPQDASSPVFVYVDDDAAGSPIQDGAFESPYETIQAGINAAPSPAVVIALPGLYVEQVTPVSGVWIVGSGAAHTRVRTPAAGPAVWFLNVPNGRLAGLTFDLNPGSVQVRCHNSVVTIRDCVVTGANNGVGIDLGSVVTLRNCLITGNASHGVWAGGSSTITAVNCTIADNTTAGFGLYSNNQLEMINTVLWYNSDDLRFGTSSTVTAICCDIGDGDCAGASGNISADPLFVTGPLHDYYLSQVAAGQAAVSPCVDAGSDTADVFGMGLLCTRTDGIRDTGIVDMGYHAAAVPLIYAIARNGDDITVWWNAVAGTPCIVEWSDDRAMWNEVAVGAVESWTDVGVLPGTPAGAKRYYRVREHAAPPGAAAASATMMEPEGRRLVFDELGATRPTSPARTTGGPNVRGGGNVGKRTAGDDGAGNVNHE